MSKKKLQRMTPQRKIILEELHNARFHPTADEIYERVRRRLPRISLGTVYRNLDALAVQGIIQKLDLAGSQRRFDVNTEIHHHVRCVSCGALEDVVVLPLYPVEKILQDTHGFEIQGVRMEFSGLCPRCKEAKTTSQEKQSQNKH